MTVASYIKNSFQEGGSFLMTLIILLWILVIFYAIRFLVNYSSENKDLKRLEKFNFTIIFIGVFGFLLSLFFRSIGIYGAMKAIERAGDVSASLMAGGYRMSLIAPIFAFSLFLTSSLVWFFFKNLIRR